MTLRMERRHEEDRHLDDVTDGRDDGHTSLGGLSPQWSATTIFLLLEFVNWILVESVFLSE